MIWKFVVKKVFKTLIVLVLLFGMTSYKTQAAIETIKDEPYFKVRYERPHLPANVGTSYATSQHLNTYHNHLQTNKQRIAQEEKAQQAKLAAIEKRKQIAQNILKEDRRESIRFRIADCKTPVKIAINNLNMNNVIDISNGGIGLRSKVLKVNDEIPVKISYKGTEAQTTLKIVNNSNGRVGGKFVKTNSLNEGKLLHIATLLEQDNKMLITRF